MRGRNANRRKRFEEELLVLRRLPERRRESCKRESLRVDSGSLIRADRNIYSVPSRLDRREGGSAVVRGAYRSVVRAEGSGAFSQVKGTEQARPSTTGTLLTGWCENRVLLPVMSTGRSCFRRAAFASPTMRCGSRMPSAATRSIWGFSIWPRGRARRRWTKRCERFWRMTSPSHKRRSSPWSNAPRQFWRSPK